MKLLLDTHIVLWAAGQPEKLSESARTLLTTTENVLFFSAASIWEIVIKRGLGREDFKVDPRRLRKMLIIRAGRLKAAGCAVADHPKNPSAFRS